MLSGRNDVSRIFVLVVDMLSGRNYVSRIFVLVVHMLSGRNDVSRSCFCSIAIDSLIIAFFVRF